MHPMVQHEAVDPVGERLVHGPLEVVRGLGDTGRSSGRPVRASAPTTRRPAARAAGAITGLMPPPLPFQNSPIGRSASAEPEVVLNGPLYASNCICKPASCITRAPVSKLSLLEKLRDHVLVIPLEPRGAILVADGALDSSICCC